MSSKTINIANEYSRFPLGRSSEYSDTSGERFRQELLIPAIRNFDQVIIELDGTEGYGSSFLDEAFANLVREEGFKREEILSKLEFISKQDPSLIKEILSYINET